MIFKRTFILLLMCLALAVVEMWLEHIFGIEFKPTKGFLLFCVVLGALSSSLDIYEMKK